MPQKIKLFLWRVCQNAISVKENLFKRRIINTPICPICCLERETVEHALLLCPWTTPIWHGSQLQLLPTPENVSSINKWLLNLFDEITKQKEFSEQRCASIVTILWLIWKGRNAYIFQQQPLKPFEVLNQAVLLVKEYVSVLRPNPANHNSQSQRGCSSLWRPPPLGKLKCNVDAAYDDQRKIGAIAAVIRDHQGNIITGKAHRIHTSSSLLAEAVAIREGLVLANSCFIDNILLESDCLRIIEDCRERRLLPEVAIVVEDILRLKAGFSSCGLLWVRREGNRVAHEVASWSLSGTLSYDWCHNLPLALKEIVYKDKIGCR